MEWSPAKGERQSGTHAGKATMGGHAQQSESACGLCHWQRHTPSGSFHSNLVIEGTSGPPAVTEWCRSACRVGASGGGFSRVAR
jgi:hypothetical protein